MKKRGGKSAALGKGVASREPVLPEVYYLVHTLWLETRAVAHREDLLCSLLHEIRKGGGVTAAMRRELKSLLAEMRGDDLLRAERALDIALHAKQRP